MNDDPLVLELRHDKKDYVTRASLERLLRAIKAALAQRKNVRVVLTTIDD